MGVTSYDVLNGTLAQDLGLHVFCSVAGWTASPPGGIQKVYIGAGPFGNQYHWFAQNTPGSHFTPDLYVVCLQ